MKYLKKVFLRFKNDGLLDTAHHYCTLIICLIKNTGHNILVKTRGGLLDLFGRFFKILPLSNSIVFECESDMADNPYAFYRFLLENEENRKYRLVWVVRNVKQCKEKYKHKNVIFLSRFEDSFSNKWKLKFYLSTAKLFLFSHPYWLTEWRKEQHVINTTHSVAQLKAGNNAIASKHLFDLVLSCNDYCTTIKKQSFGEQVCYWEVGLPRLDLIGGTEYVESTKKKISKMHFKKKLIVSMTTFKQSTYLKDCTIADRYSINVVHSLEELEELDCLLKRIDCWMIVKIHHLQDISFLENVNLDNVLYISDTDLFENNIQINELLNCADVLLTDYSSVFYDYLLLDRPIGFMIGDISEYARGFIADNPLEEMPGEIIRTLSELLSFLETSIYGKDCYQRERDQIKKKVFNFTDRNNCKRLYDRLLNEDYL